MTEQHSLTQADAIGVRKELGRQLHTFWVLGVQLAVFVVYMKLTGFGLVIFNKGGLSILVCIGVAFAIGLIGIFRLRDRNVFHLALSLTCFVFAGVVAAGTSQTALAVGFPLVDDQLLRAQQWLGFDMPQFLRLILAVPGLTAILKIAYESTVMMTFSLILILFLSKRTGDLISITFVYVASIFATTALTALTPAAGVYVHDASLADLHRLLPANAGTYHLPILEGIQNGTLREFNFNFMTGMATFPSFHTVMALLTPYACRNVRWAFWPMLAFNALVLVSVIPMGGHYLVDLFAGSIVFGLAVAAERYLRPRILSAEARPAHPQAPASAPQAA